MKRRISGAAILAIVTSVACLLAAISIVIMLGLLPPDDLVEIARLAE